MVSGLWCLHSGGVLVYMCVILKFTLPCKCHVLLWSQCFEGDDVCLSSITVVFVHKCFTFVCICLEN